MSNPSQEHLNAVYYLIRRPARILLVLSRALLLASHRAKGMLAPFFVKKRVHSPKREKTSRRLVFDAMPQLRASPSKVTCPTQTKLACETLSLESEIDWKHPYRDIEDTFALNRFGWLLAALVESPSAELARKAVRWLGTWIDAMTGQKEHPAWESYSVSERLANWPFILLILKRLTGVPENFTNDVERTLIDHLDHLLYHLEVNGKATNNHILNNARGLYIGGIVLNDPFAAEQAKKLFREWTPKMFCEEGVLREHSSHYQFLLCQRYEQIHLLAQCAGDASFLEFLERWVALMQDACEFLSVSYDDNGSAMPLFGDISPDFSPEWFLPAGGWSTLKSWLGVQEPKRKKVKTDKVIIKRKGDFIRFDTKNTSCFWHIPKNDGPYLRHGHHDRGGFVLFYRGREIFTDPGRYSYTNEGLYGIRAKAHSTVTIASLGPSCEEHRLNRLNIYEDVKSGCRISASDEHALLTMECNGFERLRRAVHWKRKFTLQKNGMVIEDILESKGNNIVESRFQIAPGIRVQQNNGILHLMIEQNLGATFEAVDRHPYSFLIIPQIDDGSDEGWVSKEYGIRARGNTLLFRRTINKAESHAYRLRWS